MGMKTVFYIFIVLIIIFLGVYFLRVSNSDREAVHTSSAKNVETLFHSDSIIPIQNKMDNVENQSHDPYATKNKGRKPKNDYICEVHLFDNSYQELENLRDFTGDPLTVKKITIQRQGIVELPSNIYEFKNIELLDISHNNLEGIDVDKIKTFKKLKNLYLNGNKITDEKINEIKTQFSHTNIFNNEDVAK